MNQEAVQDAGGAEGFDEGFWDDLLAFIEERRVIPVIGPDLAQPSRLCGCRVRGLGHPLLYFSQDPVWLAAFPLGLGHSFPASVSVVGTSIGSDDDLGITD